MDDPNAFDYRFATKPLGGQAQIGILRGGREGIITVTLETAPDTGRDEMVISSRSPFRGAKVANLSPALTDDDLVEIVRHGSSRKQEAIAVRDGLSPHVSEAVASDGSEAAVTALMGNASARVEENALNTVITRFADSDRVKASMVHRAGVV